MKFRYQLLILVLYFTITVLVMIFKQDNPELANLYIPIYFVIGLFMFNLGKIIGKQENEIKCRK